MPEITKVQITIRKFLFETRKAVSDPQKALEWLRSFRETLEFQDLVDCPNAYALAVIEEARNFNDVQKKNSQMKQVKRALGQEGVKNPSRAQMESKWRDMYDTGTLDSQYGKRERPKKNLSADATTREDVVNVPDSGDAGNLESDTSADTKIDEPSKNSYGEFGNVKMTTAEFEKLVQAEGADRANALIEELSSYLASSGKRYKSHYATLLNWCRRKDKEGEPKRKFLTADEISRRNIEESKRQLDALMAQRSVAHG